MAKHRMHLARKQIDKLLAIHTNAEYVYESSLQVCNLQQSSRAFFFWDGWHSCRKVTQNARVVFRQEARQLGRAEVQSQGKPERRCSERQVIFLKNVWFRCGIAYSCFTSYCEHTQYWSVATAWGMLLASSWSPYRSIDIYFSLFYFERFVCMYILVQYDHVPYVSAHPVRSSQDPDDDKDCHYAVMYDFQILACVIWMFEETIPWPSEFDSDSTSDIRLRRWSFSGISPKTHAHSALWYLEQTLERIENNSRNLPSFEMSAYR